MASTILSTENGNVSSNPKNIMKQSSQLTRNGQNENRRTLQTLQYATGAPISPIRKIVKPQKKSLIQKGQRPITVFADPSQKKLDDKASQTDKVQSSSEAHDMLVSEEIPESYWKDLAEERRKALNESLHENEMLHKEVAELRDQNKKLSKVASQAEYFADVLKDVLGADDEDDKSTKSDDEESCDKEVEELSEDNAELQTDLLLQDNCNDNSEGTSEGTEHEETKQTSENSQQGEESTDVSTSKSTEDTGC